MIVFLSRITYLSPVIAVIIGFWTYYYCIGRRFEDLLIGKVSRFEESKAISELVAFGSAAVKRAAASLRLRAD